MDKHLIESLVKLTALRDANQLRVFLVTEISNLSAASEVTFVQKKRSRALSRPQNGRGYEYLYYRIRDDGSIENTPNVKFHKILDAIESPKLTNRHGSTFIYPISIDRNTKEFILIKLSQLSDSLSFFLDTFFHIYKNHIELLLAAEIDELTGLQNRKAFNRICNYLFNPKLSLDEMEITTSETCFAMIDLDHFKQVNDEFGHLYGDEVLLLFAQLMIREFRTSDFLFRYGGEEFAVILTDANPGAAYEILERFRKSAELFNYPQVGCITMSIGYTVTDIDKNAALIIDEADQALYYSKKNGRNQTNCFLRLVDSGEIETKKSEPILYF
jgi:two-component system cell cycle response regulator